LLRWTSNQLARSGHSGLAALTFGAADRLASAGPPHFDFARVLWQDGQYEEAKNVLERILAVTPQHPDANNLLGDYARVLWQDGRYEEAKNVLRRILAEVPQHPEANNLVGVLCLEEGNMEEANAYFSTAIEARPDFAAAHNNLGNICRSKGDLENAERFYRTALACNSEYVESLTNLGAILNLEGNNEEAEIYCRKALILAPGFAGALCNLGNVLLSTGRGGEAVAAYRDALKLRPDIPEALVNLALILEDDRYLAGTIDYYEKQLARQPRDPLPHVRIAQALQALQRWDEARQRLARALELNLESSDALFVLSVNYVFVGDVGAGNDCLRRVLAVGPHAMAQAGLIFNSLYLEECSGKELCDQYRDWAARYVTRTVLPPSAKSLSQPGGRLKIGYVSRDFAMHSAAYFIEPILRHHDHNRFEVFCYSTQIRADDFTVRFKEMADHWRDISIMSQDKVVDLIKEDGINILIDLSGHTTGHRLGVFAHKPAPVQVTYLGHPTTTGLATIDYRLGDAVTDPCDLTKGHYVERLWQLPGCFLTYQPVEDAPDVAPPPALNRGFVTFGSFNNVAKINDHVIAVWAEILKAVTSSRLLLKGFAFSSSHGRERLIRAFENQGIARSRIDLVDWLPAKSHHLDLYREIDVALDPFPYNGTTTTCEALWMGVPVISLIGDRHSGRVGLSLLTCLGLESMACESKEAYIKLAAGLASDIDQLSTLRSSIRDRMRVSPLLDHENFTRQLERAFQEMWRATGQSVAADVAEVPVQREELRLHIGGLEAKAGWKILNIVPGNEADFVGDVRDLSAFESNSVSEVYASHVLEHVDQRSLPSVLREIRRILRKPGGRLLISVPDLEVLSSLFLREGMDSKARLHVMRMMFGGQEDAHDYHQIGLYFELLAGLLKAAGFRDIRRVESLGLFDDASDYSPYGQRISLNMVAVA